MKQGIEELKIPKKERRKVNVEMAKEMEKGENKEGEMEKWKKKIKGLEKDGK